MLPMLMMRDGEPEGDDALEPFFSSSGMSSCVRVKTRCRLRVSSFVQAASGCVSRGSPHAAPELLTSTSRPAGSSLASSAARALQASRDCRSAGREEALPPEGLPGCLA